MFGFTYGWYGLGLPDENGWVSVDACMNIQRSNKLIILLTVIHGSILKHACSHSVYLKLYKYMYSCSSAIDLGALKYPIFYTD